MLANMASSSSKSSLRTFDMVVSNFPDSFNEYDLAGSFTDFGQIVSIEIQRDGQHRLALVKFTQKNSLENVLANDFYIDNQKINISPAAWPQLVAASLVEQRTKSSHAARNSQPPPPPPPFSKTGYGPPPPHPPPFDTIPPPGTSAVFDYGHGEHAGDVCDQRLQNVEPEECWPDRDKDMRFRGSESNRHLRHEQHFVSGDFDQNRRPPFPDIDERGGRPNHREQDFLGSHERDRGSRNRDLDSRSSSDRGSREPSSWDREQDFTDHDRQGADRDEHRESGGCSGGMHHHTRRGHHGHQGPPGPPAVEEPKQEVAAVDEDTSSEAKTKDEEAEEEVGPGTQLLIMHIESPVVFWAQRKEQNKEFKEIQARLVDVGRLSCVPKSNPEFRRIYGGRFLFNWKWNRCQLVRYVSPGQHEMLAIDFGVSEVLPHTSIVELSDSFSMLDGLALQYCLLGLEATNNQRLFETGVRTFSVLKGRRVFAIMNQPVNGKIPVVITTEDGLDGAEVMLKTKSCFVTSSRPYSDPVSQEISKASVNRLFTRKPVMQRNKNETNFVSAQKLVHPLMQEPRRIDTTGASLAVQVLPSEERENRVDSQRDLNAAEKPERVMKEVELKLNQMPDVPCHRCKTFSEKIMTLETRNRALEAALKAGESRARDKMQQPAPPSASAGGARFGAALVGDAETPEASGGAIRSSVKVEGLQSYDNTESVDREDELRDKDTLKARQERGLSSEQLRMPLSSFSTNIFSATNTPTTPSSSGGGSVAAASAVTEADAKTPPEASGVSSTSVKAQASGAAAAAASYDEESAELPNEISEGETLEERQERLSKKLEERREVKDKQEEYAEKKREMEQRKPEQVTQKFRKYKKGKKEQWRPLQKVRSDLRHERLMKKLAERRELKAQEEEDAEKKREMERRKLGQETQNQWTTEMEKKEYENSYKEEKEEQRRALERVRADLERDRQDRAERYKQDKELQEEAKERAKKAKLETEAKRLDRENATKRESCRVQFRMPDGSSITQVFSATDTLSTARSFIQQKLNNKPVTLSTTYPKRMFLESDMASTLLDLELVPSSVLIVLPGTSRGHGHGHVATTESDSTSFIWILLAPLLALWNFICNFLFPAVPPPVNRQDNQNVEPTETNSPSAAADAGSRNTQQQPKSQGLRQRKDGNINRLTADDEDDDSATWNGNSTQQM